MFFFPNNTKTGSFSKGRIFLKSKDCSHSVESIWTKKVGSNKNKNKMQLLISCNERGTASYKVLCFVPGSPSFQTHDYFALNSSSKFKLDAASRYCFC